MKYENIVEGKFISRPNRFIANVEIGEETVICHVKNTGRCRELLIPGARVILEQASSPARKTGYDLVSVYKGDALINMDSQAPNRIAEEYLKREYPGWEIRREVKAGNSRIDFCIEKNGKKVYIEVKGVTLEENGVAMVPDAPTLRGLKHVEELTSLVKEGHGAAVLFVVQMKGIRYVTPNMATQPEFGYALIRAAESGVNIMAVDCRVTENSVTADLRLPVILSV